MQLQCESSNMPFYCRAVATALQHTGTQTGIPARARILPRRVCTHWTSVHLACSALVMQVIRMATLGLWGWLQHTLTSVGNRATAKSACTASLACFHQTYKGRRLDAEMCAQQGRPEPGQGKAEPDKAGQRQGSAGAGA